MDPDKTSIVLGAAGCGKTAKLLNCVEEAMSAGVPPKRIGYISFTKKAVEEARSRASVRFNLPEEDFPHFKTIHAMAFRHLGMRRDQVLNWRHMAELGKILGIDFKGRGDQGDDSVYGMNAADRMLFLEGLARNSKRPLAEVWRSADEDEVDFLELERFSKALLQFKRSRMLLDYSDMVEGFCRTNPESMPQLDLLVIDEIQDTSALQWDAVELIASKAKNIIVAGDDCQGIYAWSGADVQRFIQLPGKQETLEQSYRVPRAVARLADSITDRIQSKRPRSWLPKDEEGAVNWYSDIDQVDLSKGNWLCLGRNGYLLEAMEDHCLSEGFSFHSVNRDPLNSPALTAIKTWENLRKGNDEPAKRVIEVLRYISPQDFSVDLFKKLKSEDSDRTFGMPELVQNGLRTTKIWHLTFNRMSPFEQNYFLAARRKGEALLKEPRIKISTIHTSKGTESENVLLLTDISFRCYQNADKDPDSENRVLYVGLTRCSKTLNLIAPRTNLCFEL